MIEKMKNSHKLTSEGKKELQLQLQKDKNQETDGAQATSSSRQRTHEAPPSKGKRDLPPGWTKSYTTLSTNDRKIMKLEHTSGRRARSIEEAWRIHNSRSQE